MERDTEGTPTGDVEQEAAFAGRLRACADADGAGSAMLTYEG
ncbi:hypothetical protein AAHZ94_28340 [Streptomyces sp. HSW2009]